MQPAIFSLHLIVIAIIILLAYMAVYDYRFGKIRNNTVLALLAGWVALAALEGFSALLDSLAAGALMFALGFGAWMLRMLGAGDAKLLGVAGLMLGLTALAPFAVGLVLATLGFVVAMYMLRSVRMMLPPAILVRVDGIAQSRRIPAAVPIAISLAVTLPIRYGLLAL